MIRVAILPLMTLFFATLATPSTAEIIGNLETPDGYASQIGNVQGWVYTTTPGAELIQPFDVLINGVKAFEVPCCSARGDVKGEDPDIPLQTGFSGVTNWTREAGKGPIIVQVRVKDTKGGDVLLTKSNIDVYSATSFPFSSIVTWQEADGVVSDGPQGGAAPAIASRCTLSNTGVFTPFSAELSCTGVTATGGPGTETCDGAVRYSWDRASQGFKQTGNCEPQARWTNHGNGTATDNTTGLIWELKTNNGSIHDMDNTYSWTSSGGLVPPATGSAFTVFLRTLNRSLVSTPDGPEERCFAGRCDWRLPSISELANIYDAGIPGETADGSYWTISSTPAGGLTPEIAAWRVDFETGATLGANKTISLYVRAVRGGS